MPVIAKRVPVFSGIQVVPRDVYSALSIMLRVFFLERSIIYGKRTA